MDGWTIGLIAVVVLGVAAILAGALIDRSRTRRAREEMLAPPAREIPQFRPDQPPPRYLTELQARRPPTDRPARSLAQAERDRLEDQLRSSAAVTVAAPLAGEAFVTDEPTGRAVLDEPMVLLCGDGIGSIRELLPAMERAALSARPLVIAAPGVAGDVLATVEVNVIQGKLRLAVVRADASAQAMISELTTAGATTAADRQAGFFPAEVFGSAPCWVAGKRDSVIVTSTDAPLAT